MNMITLVVAIIAAVIAVLAVPPATFLSNAAEYGSILAKWGIIFWPYLAAVVAFIAARLLSRILIRNLATLCNHLRAEFAIWLETRIDERIKAHKNELANLNPRTIAEMLVRSPIQLETLAGHLGIGKPTTGIDSVQVRLKRLEQQMEGSAEMVDDIRNIAVHVDKLQHSLNIALDWTRTQFERRDALAALAEHWPLVLDHAAMLVSYFDKPQEAHDWDTWFSKRDKWRQEYEAWSSFFPDLKAFNAVRDVLNVSGMEVAYSHSKYAKNFRFGQTKQENAYFTFLAINERLQKEAPAALKELQDMASVNSKV